MATTITTTMATTTSRYLSQQQASKQPYPSRRPTASPSTNAPQQPHINAHHHHRGSCQWCHARLAGLVVSCAASSFSNDLAHSHAADSPGHLLPGFLAQAYTTTHQLRLDICGSSIHQLEAAWDAHAGAAEQWQWQLHVQLQTAFTYAFSRG
eukprot:jgi/Ulvmu1/5956/UM026_0078.1